MRKLVAAITFALLPAAGASAQSIGACAWAGVPASIRTAFMSAYKVGMDQGMASLQSADPELSASFQRCAGRKDIPKRWAQGATGSSAIQSAAAAELLAYKHLGRSSLDQAWAEAPEAARDCTKANAQKVFGLNQATCSDPRAPVWFLQHFAISPQTDRPAASQLLVYYNAKAQDGWAEALIARFKAQPLKPAG